jgi:inosine-uridine nucleoside N-ribohydrolase
LPAQVRVWLDSDIGRNPDDAVAVLVAVTHPAVDLVGVSITGDDPPAQAETARSLLVWAGRPDVPVVLPAGAPDALSGADVDVLVAIGPLTNVAAALRSGPPPARLVVMGGALRPVEHRGRLHRVEWNFARDPRAAASTLARAPRCTLVPLDATVATRLDPLRQRALVAAAPPLGPLVEAWLAALRTDGVPDASATVHLHDPAAVLVAAGDGPQVGAHCRELRLGVEPDGRLVEDPAAPPVEVVMALDGPAVAERVISLLEGTNRTSGR